MSKYFSFNSIRSRMVSGFLFLTFLILVLAIVSVFIFDSITRISRSHSDLGQLQIYTLSLMKNDNDFFDIETINESYFKTRESDFINSRDSLNKLITTELESVLSKEKQSRFGISEPLLKIDSTLDVYNAKFMRLESLIFKKGFKDYGIEGAMRYHAHALEEVIDDNDRLNLLYLRRHEKDFLLRSDTSYLTSFKKRTVQFHLAIQDRRKGKYEDVEFHLSEYRRLFLELADIQQELGLSSKHGLRSELNALTYSLSSQYYSLSEYAFQYTDTVYARIRIFYIALLAGAIIFSIISGYWISKRLSEPIARLSKIIKNAVTSRNSLKTDLSMLSAAVEIKTLGNSFNVLMDEVNAQMNTVTIKNSELEKTNRELDNFLYSTAHDLRSPLTSLLGLINLIRHENKQENLIVYFEFMEKSITRSENFISQIVSYSQNKKMGITAELLDLRNLISGILESHQFIEGFTRISKHIIIHGDIAFHSDRNRIVMILTNLISNSIKYADLRKSEPYIRITITVNHYEAQIEFADNGLGIDEVHIANIFNMFYRANFDSKGSGLGLFIFKETLTRLEGHASVESSLGVGTKFFIRIPNLVHTAKHQEGIDFKPRAAALL